MAAREYYSQRKGRTRKLDLDDLRKLFIQLYDFFSDEGYFEKAFGVRLHVICAPPAYSKSTGRTQMALRLKRDDLWPIEVSYREYSEDDLFDVVEFLYMYVAKTSASSFAYGQEEAGRTDYRQEVNELLRHYGDGYRLSEDGRILTLAPDGLRDLEEKPLPSLDPENVEQRVKAAIVEFGSRHAMENDKRHAVNDLCDVLEFLKPQAEQVLTHKDAKDLYQIMNRFGIRHHDDKQQTNYDKNVFLEWLFYYFLAAIHSTARLIEKGKTQAET